MSKITEIRVEEQVKFILHKHGYSHIFNWTDFIHFREYVKDAYNQAQEIANLFIEEAQQYNIESDYSQYIF